MGDFEVEEFASSAAFPVEGDSHSGRSADDRVDACMDDSLVAFVAAHPTINAINAASTGMVIKIITTGKGLDRFMCSKLLAKH
ncbi:MAG: hypothetical protein ACOYMU_02010 [Phycisphaerales bacterium]|jgi:hypothetical protein